MKDIIVAKLQEIVGLSEEQAAKAADVVMDVVGSGGAEGIASKISGMASGLGGMLGGDKKEGE